VTAVRETGAGAYTDGRGTFHPPERRIERGAAITGECRVRADVCVIGSGAGGAVVAKELAEAGFDVVILEDGEWVETDELTARPREMTSKLYRDGGQLATVGNVPIVLPLGRAVGGTTLVNSGTCFRTPASVLSRWRRQAGLELDGDILDPYFRRVERILNVSQVPPELAGRNAEVIRRGCETLGWSSDYLYRNAKGCVGSGVCAFGCPTGAKQHTGITYIPRAWAAGATTFTGVRARRIERHDGHATSVVAATRGGGTLHVTFDRLVVAAGTIHTPLLLERNGLGVTSGQLGRNLAIHPATAVRAVFDETIESWRGVPQSYYVDEFADEGIMFEGAAGPPDYFAMAVPALGDELRELMLDFAHMAQFGVMISDRSRGRVLDVAGRPVIRYDLVQEDVTRFHRGIELLTRIYWAAGARVVMAPLPGMPPLRDGEIQPILDATVRASDLELMAFHPLGTARAGTDPAASVVDGDLRLHGSDNVYIADGSVVPSSLGVNPQITIMALATRLAYSIAGAAPPDDEPHPEHIARPRVDPRGAAAAAAA
jgi:choline dehydrogenase-like flavoprotein